MPVYSAMVKSKPDGKMKPHTFKLPSGYQSDDDSEVKEALLKFKENDDGTCEMISLDGAPFKDDRSDTKEESEEPTTEAEMEVGGEENAMPEDMEGAITALQKRDRMR